MNMLSQQSSFFASHLWLLLPLFYAVAGDQQADVDTLRHLSLVYRHGDRAPIKLYPNDPNPESFWKMGLGQLTNKGKMQHYLNGFYLRNRYDGFLTDNKQEVYVQSSAVDRCLESVASDLASLYKPKGIWVWNQNLSWQPFSIHSMPLDIDPMLTVSSKCPEYDKEMDKIRAGDEAQTFLKDNANLFDYVSNCTGTRVHDWDDGLYIQDTVLVEQLYNLPQPNWVDPVWKQLCDLRDFYFYIPFSTKRSQVFRGGPLLGDIVSKMQEKSQNPSSPIKLNVYSTHDNVVSALLMALGVFNKMSPPYFATVLVELHEKVPNNYIVRLFYRNETTHEPYPLTIPNCDFDCPLDNFVELTKDVVPLDWKKECGLDNGN